MSDSQPYISPVTSVASDKIPLSRYVTVPVPNEGDGSQTFWQTEILRASEVRKKRESKWKQNLKRYEAERPSLFGYPSAEIVTVPIDFANTEAKKAQLFYQSPDLILNSKRKDDGSTTALAQAVINDVLRHQVAIMPTVEELLMDVICPAGIGCVEIGYQAYFGQPIPEPVMVPDTSILAKIKAMAGVKVPPVPALNPDGTPQTQDVPNLVRERYFVERASPMKFLQPADFDKSNYDLAWWLGREDLISTDACKQEFGVIPQVARVDTDERRLVNDADAQMAARMVRIVRIWYQSCRIRPDVADPLRMTQLVIAHGSGSSRDTAQVLIHRDSPYQVVDKRGKFVRGMIGNPIHPLTIRYTSDSGWPLSDCSISRPQVDELSAARTQNQMQRRRDIPLRAVDVASDPNAKETVERIEKGQWQGVVPTQGDPDKIIKVIARASFPPENFQFQRITETDIARSWALGANQNGVAVDASTATEAEIMQRNTDTRLAKERGKVLDWYVRLAEKLFALVQMFSDENDYVEVLGADGAKVLTQWNATAIQGMYRFSARPDSTIRIDQAAERERGLRFYNQVRNDPQFNGLELDKWLCELWGIDGARFLVETPPEKTPESPKLSVSISPADFIPGSPTALAAMALAEACGMDMEPFAQAFNAEAGIAHQGAPKQPTQDEHPGAANSVETIDQHEADRTGERNGPKVALSAEAGSVR